MKKHFLLFLTIFVFFSCVPGKDLVYLSGDPVDFKEIQRINNVPYKLQVDDIIYIDIKSTNKDLVTVFRKQDANVGASGQVGNNLGAGYFTDYSVDNYGNIRIPTIGNVNVLGYTVTEVREKIESELKKFIKDEENLFITVKLSGIRFTIIGEVSQPGTKVLFQNRVSVLEAIANSGDITDVGNRKAVEIIRNTGFEVKKFTIDLTKIEALNSDVFYIKPNDYINVLPLKQKAWGTGTTGLESLSTFVSIFTLITSTIVLAKNL
ncbi:polysaccharide biosynthesis/export family protein [Polaribacter aquimarinus]|uniref:Sugar transporter n=1 Tax=Polaribacter aquimarinus TaxID=2100726 RepID=A0A2U2J904_9FLAO|nr:polysaccharide biosynthesis/export family protein [Polaribacter aquimarinus]PWG04828.1 sugar transporter [Polaribacter aquimarinus]